ncbi:dTDP-D-glucose 4,6-dehydratase [SAR116 cluster alpha proteobacterium HIMB100]|nr:dTDP-D-glucose 4,6-dehydratase [SAR116 cluster alpha proteobacterium HIMB100]
MIYNFQSFPQKRDIEKALIIGSNSFAGAATVDGCLHMGMKVWGVSRSRELQNVFNTYRKNKNVSSFTFTQLNINKQHNQLLELIDVVRPDAIIDFAGQGMVAQSWENPEQWYQTNILAKAKLHRFLIGKEYLKAYVRISTPEVYGSSEKLLTESSRYNPSTPYAVSHAATDMSLNAFFKHYNFPIITARFANFYGPGQQLYRIVPKTMLAALGCGSLTLDGGGTSIRSFIYSSDIVSGVLAALFNGAPGETYHFSNSEFVSISELVAIICDLMDVQQDTFCKTGPERIGKDAAYLMSSDKAAANLGWSPQTTLNKGLSETAEWIVSNFQKLKTLPLEYIHTT